MASNISDNDIRFCRLCLLVFGKGREVLADVLKKTLANNYGSTKTLQDVLNDVNVKNVLSHLNPAVFTTDQKDLLFPHHYTEGLKVVLGTANPILTYNDFDITLMYLLLRNIGGLPWTSYRQWNIPNPTDISSPACVARLRGTRNMLGHSPRSINNVVFQNKWPTIVDDLLKLSKLYSQQDYDKLKVNVLDVNANLEAIICTMDDISKKRQEDTRLLEIKLSVISLQLIVKLKKQEWEKQNINLTAEQLGSKQINIVTETLKHEDLKTTACHMEWRIQEDSNDIHRKIDAVAIQQKKEVNSWRPEGDKRHPSEKIPDRNPNFTGRDSIMTTIHTKLTQSVSTRCQRITLAGLGGTGKTETALEYAHRFRNNYHLVRWLVADNESLQQSILSFCDDLGIDTAGLPMKDVTILLYKKLQQIPKWFLIDNAENCHAMKSFLPETSFLKSYQHVLVTSQNQEWNNNIVPLDVFTREESLDFLKKVFKHSEENGQLTRLCAELDNLPLALNHASACILQTPGFTVNKYLQLFQEQSLVLLLPKIGFEKNSEKNIVKTFLATLSKIREKDATAVKILYKCAVLSPENIPISLFTNENTVDTFESLRVLENFSLLSGVSQASSVKIHHLLLKAVIHSFHIGNIQQNILISDVFKPLVDSIVVHGT